MESILVVSLGALLDMGTALFVVGTACNASTLMMAV